MKAKVRLKIRDWKEKLQNLTEEEMVSQIELLDGILSCCNASCDAFRDLERENTQYDRITTKNWWADQELHFYRGRQAAAKIFAPIYKGKNGFDVIDVIDEIADCWRAHNDAMKESAEARESAERLL